MILFLIVFFYKPESRRKCNKSIYEFSTLPTLLVFMSSYVKYCIIVVTGIAASVYNKTNKFEKDITCTPSGRSGPSESLVALANHKPKSKKKSNSTR